MCFKYYTIMNHYYARSAINFETDYFRLRPGLPDFLFYFYFGTILIVLVLLELIKKSGKYRYFCQIYEIRDGLKPV